MKGIGSTVSPAAEMLLFMIKPLRDQELRPALPAVPILALLDST